MTDISVDIALDRAEALARRAVRLLGELRRAHNLAAYEFTRAVRIAPLEIPHSHPVLTLSCRWVDDPDQFLAMYLHEQMHWYLTEYRHRETKAAIEALDGRYPNRPPAKAEGAQDDYSVLLHLVVNWLEVSALRALLGEDRARAAVTPAPAYPWCYATVRNDWTELGALCTGLGLSPIPDARRM
ncbi:MAG: hypothetical protein AAGH68_13270 [Pseudomonadota bacterium]